MSFRSPPIRCIGLHQSRSMQTDELKNSVTIAATRRAHQSHRGVWGENDAPSDRCIGTLVEARHDRAAAGMRLTAFQNLNSADAYSRRPS